MKFCILAAGKGTRTNSVSKIHKALLPINNKAVISHIIEKAPDQAEIIIAVGYQKELIKEYCLASHPFKKIQFIEIDNYDGPGSGPGYSLLKCKEHLNEPFYLICSDCLTEEPYPDLSFNWLGVHPVTDSENWSTAKVENGNIVEFKNKDKNGFKLAWIGVAGIKDHENFWTQINQGNEKEFEVVSAFYNPQSYRGFRAKVFTWHDTGTTNNYNKTKEVVKSQKSLGMEKTIDEITYKCDHQCVKIFKDEKVCKGRVKRAKVLSQVTPELTFSGDKVYAYNWIEGKTLYENESVANLERLLKWCDKNLWQVTTLSSIFEKQCNDFYYEKTQKRLAQYFEKYGEDEKCVINGLECQPIKTLLNKIDWEELSHGLPVTFHGDFQPENIIVTEDDNFYLIDWRDCFAGEELYGDLFYDLAKLNGGLSMSYHNIKENKFEFTETSKEVKYSFETSKELDNMKLFFENWIMKRKLSLRKVRVLTALIHLNMAPLHTTPFDKLLFNHAKYQLSII